jgi:hypothetical protein
MMDEWSRHILVTALARVEQAGDDEVKRLCNVYGIGLDGDWECEQGMKERTF